LTLSLGVHVVSTEALRLRGEQSRNGGRGISSVEDEVDVGARRRAIVEADAGNSATSGADAGATGGSAEVGGGDVGEGPEVAVKR
jgi:hypothetical protein